MNHVIPRCPECAAPLPDGLDCWGMLCAILAWEWNDPDLSAEHFVTVASFNIQHPSRFTEQSVEFLKKQFAEHLDMGTSTAEIRRRVEKQLSGMVRNRSEPQPVQRLWSLTVADVYANGDPAGAAQKVRDWAAAVKAEL